MSHEQSFVDLIHLVRKGSQEAATELVSRYESVIRRAVRLRLQDARLGAALDSMDIAQAVFASFFVRAAAGQYELATPAQLVNLLVTMARNKLASQVRKEQRERRDYRRSAAETTIGEVASSAPGPGQQLAAQELLHRVYQSLTPEELKLVELRNQRQSWDDIAGQVGGNAVVLRKKLSRALDRITRDLGLEEP